MIRVPVAAEQLLQSGQPQPAYAGRAAFDEPSGRAALGSDAFYHCYQASDGWFFFAAPTETRDRLAATADLAGLAQCPDLISRLSQRFKTKPIAYWAEHLNAGASAVVPLASMLETRDDALETDSKGPADIEQATFRAVRHDTHPMGLWCDLAAPNAIRPERAQIRVPSPAPKYGSDTRAMLKRFEFSEQQIDDMLAEGSAGESWSVIYLPK